MVIEEFVSKARTVCDEISMKGLSCEDCPLAPNNNFSSENCGYEMLHHSEAIEKDLDDWIAEFIAPAKTSDNNKKGNEGMEFKELMKMAERLCNSMDNCIECPLRISLNCGSHFIKNPDSAMKIILEYAKNHPEETLATKFKKMFPDSPAADYPSFCPAVLGKSFTGENWKVENHCGNGCDKCWNAVIQH